MLFSSLLALRMAGRGLQGPEAAGDRVGRERWAPSRPSSLPGLPALSSRPGPPKAPGQLLPGARGVFFVTQAESSRLGHSLGARTPGCWRLKGPSHFTPQHAVPWLPSPTSNFHHLVTCVSCFNLVGEGDGH